MTGHLAAQEWSPWGMMEEWGVPSLYLHSAAYEFSEILRANGQRVPDLALLRAALVPRMEFSKALALGAPYAKAVCMGRALGYLAWLERILSTC